MKNNINKKFIKSNNIHDFHYEFASLTQVHFIFLIKNCFLSISSSLLS